MLKRKNYSLKGGPYLYKKGFAIKKELLFYKRKPHVMKNAIDIFGKL